MMQTLELDHFDGSTLLGFLAAVGALRTLSLAGVADVQLAFDEADSHARLRAAGASDLRETLSRALCDPSLAEGWVVRGADETVFGQPSDVSVDEVAAMLRSRLNAPAGSRRIKADILSALIADEPDDNGSAVSTELRAVGGGRLQYFQQIALLFKNLQATDVERTLSSRWTHEDAGGGLRLSPEEDRPYALRASDPAPEGASGERAANILAVVAQTLLPVLPQRRGETIGFESRSKTFRWPLWSAFCGVGAVRAILAIADSEKPDSLRRMGVFRLMTARRFTRGQYRNFTPAMAEW